MNVLEKLNLNLELEKTELVEGVQET